MCLGGCPPRRHTRQHTAPVRPCRSPHRSLDQTWAVVGRCRLIGVGTSWLRNLPIRVSHFGEPLPPRGMRNCLAYNLLEWGEAGAREQLSDSGPAPPFLDDARPFQGLHLRYHSFRFRQWGEGDVDCYCTPSAQALEHLRKRPLTYLVSVSFFCIVLINYIECGPTP